MNDILALLPPKRQNIYKYYRLELTEDGTTLQRTGDKTVFHPILSAYLICDFIDLYIHDPQPRYADIARRLADRALTRASVFADDSLVFWYEPGSGLSNVPGRFYSGLTQSWFVRAFARMSRIDERHAATVRRFFASLTVPVERGGALLDKDYGWVIEEYPHEPAFYTLNGWLSTLRFILQDRVLLQRAGCPIDVFLRKNLDAAEALLPRFDLPHLRNSRYQLTGFARVKLVMASSDGYDFEGFSTTIPGECTLESAARAPDNGRWKNFVERRDGRTVVLNTVLSMISAPKPNVVGVRLSVGKATSFTAYLAEGDYDPRLTAMRTERWSELGTFALVPGRNRVDVPVSLGPTSLVAYPTNFNKRIYGAAGKTYNAYHFLHILDLATLYNQSGRESFRAYARKWMDYILEWPTVPELDDPGISLEHYSNESFFPSMERLLAAKPRATF